MFRFSIRELMLVTLVLALGVAWFADHATLRVALNEATGKSERQDTEIGEIRKQLKGHGLEMMQVVYADGHPGVLIARPVGQP
jgi:hypothetical protein